MVLATEPTSRQIGKAVAQQQEPTFTIWPARAGRCAKLSLDKQRFVWYIIGMNNRTENLLNNHIARLQQDILERDQTTLSDGTRCNPFHAQLDEVDLKNIASLREGRIPKYGDHMECFGNGPAEPMDMFEFSDLTREKEQEAKGLYAGTEPSLV